MGRVWRAADEILDRPVAVKEMRIDGLDAEDTRTRRERTLREARATARIDHPNVVRVYDVVDEGERLWIVMELVVGRSLEQMTVQDGPLNPRQAARIGVGLVTALRQVHERGVLHRDIKPGNVLVEDAGERVVLTDFGIAAMQDAKALTMVGMLVGSPDYMAPERISGRPQGPPSDIWSLGATLCAALGGRSPFSRDTTLATLHAVLYEEPQLPLAAGPLRDILAALLEKDPTVRPGLEELEAALRPVAFPPTLVTLPVGGGEAPAGEPEEVRETEEAGTAGEVRAEAEGEAAEGEEEEPVRAEEPDPSTPPPPPPPPPPSVHTRVLRLPRDPRLAEPIEDAPPTQRPASAEAHSELRSEAHSEVQSQSPTPTEIPITPSAPPTQRRSGVSLVRAQAVTQQRPEPANSPAPATRSAAPRPDLGPHPLRTPAADLPDLAVPATPSRGRRRAAVMAAVGVVTAGAVVAVVLLANSGSAGGDRADGSTSPQASSSASTSPSGPSSPSPTVEGTARPQSLPPGAHREAGGFAWATPTGWRRDLKTGAEVHYTSPDGGQELVGKSSIARGDLMRSWETSEQNAHQGQGYRKIRLERTTFRGNPAVVWEYTFTLKGVQWHAQLLGFDQEGRSYQINTWYQPPIEAQALRTYDTVKDSFTVL
ncbi:protein kinase [Streptomyces sp. NPDC092369]|uniref:serine/threonine-protein kinase n=1 Tax=Streptomyces sp. NPDC092369 TaxID=3366015 RepID=UPI00381B190F